MIDPEDPDHAIREDGRSIVQRAIDAMDERRFYPSDELRLVRSAKPFKFYARWNAGRLFWEIFLDRQPRDVHVERLALPDTSMLQIGMVFGQQEVIRGRYRPEEGDRGYTQKIHAVDWWINRWLNENAREARKEAPRR